MHTVVAFDATKYKPKNAVNLARNLKLAAGIALLWALGFAFAMTSDRVVGAVLEAVR